MATVRATTAYQPGRRALEEDVSRLREGVDILVVSCHWGVSGSSEVADYQRAMGRAAIRAGADVVVGHHPHVIQGSEVYRGRPIFYSLSNFAFDWLKMRGRALDGPLVRCTVTGQALSSVSFVPVRRNDENLVKVCVPESAAGRAILAPSPTLLARSWLPRD